MKWSVGFDLDSFIMTESFPAFQSDDNEPIIDEPDSLSKYISGFIGKKGSKNNEFSEENVPKFISKKPLTVKIVQKPAEDLPKQFSKENTSDIEGAYKETIQMFSQENYSVEYIKEDFKKVANIEMPESNFVPKAKPTDDINMIEQKDVSADDDIKKTYGNYPENLSTKISKEPTQGRQLLAAMFNNYNPVPQSLSLTGYTSTSQQESNPILYFRLDKIDLTGCVVENLEPLYLTLALYDLSTLTKLSEDVHIDLTDRSFFSITSRETPTDPNEPNHCEYEPEPEKQKYTAFDRCAFTMNTTEVENVYLLLFISKPLHDEKDGDIGAYMNSIDERLKSKNKAKNEKTKEKYAENTNRLGAFQQIFAFGMLKIMEFGNWETNGTVLNQDSLKPLELPNEPPPKKESGKWPSDVMMKVKMPNLYPFTKDTDEENLIKSVQEVLRKPADYKPIPSEILITIMHLSRTSIPRYVTVHNEHVDLQKRKEFQQSSLIGNATKAASSNDMRDDDSKKPFNPELAKDDPLLAVRLVQSFLTPKLPLSPQSFYHFLYVKPKVVDFAGKVKGGRARNVCIEVCVKEADSYNANVLPVIYGGSHCDHMVKKYRTAITYHEEKPHFMDEIKIALPLGLKPGMHILFTFYHISCQAALVNQKDKKDARKLFNKIGYCVIPIENDDDIRETGGVYSVVEALPSQYVSAFKGLPAIKSGRVTGEVKDDPTKNVNIVDPSERGGRKISFSVIGDKPIFTCELKLASTIVPNNEDIRVRLSKAKEEEKSYLEKYRDLEKKMIDQLNSVVKSKADRDNVDDYFKDDIGIKRGEVARSESFRLIPYNLSLLSYDCLNKVTRKTQSESMSKDIRLLSDMIEKNSKVSKDDMDFAMYFAPLANILFKRMMKFPDRERIRIFYSFVQLLSIVKRVSKSPTFKVEILVEYIEKKLNPFGDDPEQPEEKKDIMGSSQVVRTNTLAKSVPIASKATTRFVPRVISTPKPGATSSSSSDRSGDDNDDDNSDDFIGTPGPLKIAKEQLYYILLKTWTDVLAEVTWKQMTYDLASFIRKRNSESNLHPQRNTADIRSSTQMSRLFSNVGSSSSDLSEAGAQDLEDITLDKPKVQKTYIPLITPYPFKEERIDNEPEKVATEMMRKSVTYISNNTFSVGSVSTVDFVRSTASPALGASSSSSSSSSSSAPNRPLPPGVLPPKNKVLEFVKKKTPAEISKLTEIQPFLPSIKKWYDTSNKVYFPVNDTGIRNEVQDDREVCHWKGIIQEDYFFIRTNANDKEKEKEDIYSLVRFTWFFFSAILKSMYFAVGRLRANRKQSGKGDIKFEKKSSLKNKKKKSDDSDTDSEDSDAMISRDKKKKKKDKDKKKKKKKDSDSDSDSDSDDSDGGKKRKAKAVEQDKGPSSEHDYSSLFPKYFYDLLKEFIVYYSIFALHSARIYCHDLINELAAFIVNLYGVAKREEVNQLIIIFLTVFDHSQTKLRSESNQEIAVEALLNFWEYLTSSPQWMLQAFLSGQEGKNDKSLVKDKSKNADSFTFFLPHIFIKSIFDLQSHIVEITKLREMNKDSIKKPDIQRQNSLYSVQVQRRYSVAARLNPVKVSGMGTAKEGSPLTRAMTTSTGKPMLDNSRSPLAAHDSDSDDGMISDDDDMDMELAKKKKEEGDNSESNDDFEEEGDEEGFAIADIDGVKDKTTSDTVLRPFHLFREMLTRFDMDNNYQTVEARTEISRLFFEFLKATLDKTFLLEEFPLIEDVEKCDNHISCAWLLRNCDVLLYRRFIESLISKERAMLLSLYNSLIAYFQIDELIKLLKNMKIIEKKTSDRKENLKNIEKGISMSMDPRSKGTYRDRKKDKTLRYNSIHTRVGVETNPSIANSSRAQKEALLAASAEDSDSDELGTIRISSGNSLRMSLRVKRGDPLNTTSSSSQDSSSSDTSQDVDKEKLDAMDIHHAVTETVIAALSEYAIIMTQNKYILKKIEVKNEFIDQTSSPAKLYGVLNSSRGKIQISDDEDGEEEERKAALSKKEEGNDSDDSSEEENEKEDKFDYSKKEEDALRHAIKVIDYDFDTKDKYRNDYKKCTRRNHFAEDLDNIWLVLAQLMEGEHSVEVIRRVFALASFLIQIGGYNLIVETKDTLNTLVENLLAKCCSQNKEVREDATCVLYRILKMNYLIKNNITRVSSLFSFKVSSIAFVNDEEQESVIKCIKDLESIAKIDGQAESEFKSSSTELTKKMLSVFAENVAIRVVEGKDPEMKADLLSSLVDSYFRQPEIRIGELTKLIDHLHANNCPDEEAIAQTEKAAIILDILTSFWREDKDLTNSFVFPQYLPVNSLFTRIDNNGNLAVKALDVGGAVPLAPLLQGKRRYGSSWLCWDRMLKEVIPGFKIYNNEDNIALFRDKEVCDSLKDSNLFTTEICVSELDKASKLLTKANMYEYSVVVDELLLSFYRATNDFKAQKKIHERICKASLEPLINTKDIKARIQTYWYRVGLYGKMFDKENGVEYIMKEYNFTKLGDLRHKLVDKYKKRFGKEPVIITDAKSPDKESLMQKDTPHIHLTAVDPYFSETDKDDRRTDFMKKVNVSQFFFDSTYLIAPKKKKEPGLEELHLRRTMFTTEYSLPYHTRRVRVKEGGREEIEFSPAQKSAMDVEQKINELLVVMNPINERQVQLLLKGMIAPEVNAGPMAIYHCFLVDHKEETPEKDIELIKETFDHFFTILRKCLIDIKDTGISSDFREGLIEKYNQLLQDVSDELPDRPPLVKGLDY